MKPISLATKIQFIIGSILPTLCLCGFLGWLISTPGPKLPKGSILLSEKKALWSQFIGYDSKPHLAQLSTFTQDGSLIIAKQANTIFVIDPKNGQTRWKQSVNHELTNPPATHHKSIFIATSEPRLLALNLDTQNIVWSVPLPHTVRAQVAADQNQVIAKTISGEVLAFNTKNGKLLWRYKHANASTALSTSSAPQWTEHQVFIGFPDGKLVALNRADGVKTWEHTVSEVPVGLEFDKLVDIAAAPVLDTKNSLIYVNTYHGKLKCLSLETGVMKWEHPFSGYAPLALGKHLYGLDENYVLYAFNQTDGTILWEQPAFKDRQVIGPVVTEKETQLVVADQEGNVYWLTTKQGDIFGKASFTIASPIASLPLTRDNKVYVINQRSQIAAWQNPKGRVSVKTETNTEPTPATSAKATTPKKT
jgi:outer membrane protein assembly factor BamB